MNKRFFTGLLIAIISVALTALTTINTAHAAGVIFVDADATGANDGTSWDDAYVHLQDALAAAMAGDQLWVAEGIYYPDEGVGQVDGDQTATFQLINGVEIYGGFGGFETLLNQRTPNIRITVLSGDIDQNDVTDSNGVITDLIVDENNLTNENINGLNAHTVITGSGTDATALLDGFTITAGAATQNGGGMYNNAGSPTLTGITFSGNYAGTGAAMYNEGGSNPTLTNTHFESNLAFGFGGAMWNRQSNPTISSSTFSNNMTYIHGGGAMVNVDSSNPVLTDVVFAGNLANYDDTGSGFGGAMWNEFNSAPTLTNVSFISNTATQGGGAMFNLSNSNPTLTNVIFAGNVAIDTNYGGGAIHSQGSDITLTNVTFFGNEADKGGALFNQSGTHTIENSVFWQNTAVTGDAMLNDASSTVTITHTLIDSSSIDGLWTDNGSNITDGSDPLLRDADGADNIPGTADDDLRPMLHSPLVDAGDNALVPVGVTTDLNGVQRIVDGDGDTTATVDMGAYEAVPPIYVDVDATGANDGTSWTDAYVHLQDGLAVVQNGQAIWVAEGIYYPDDGVGQTPDDIAATFQLVDGAMVYGGFDGSETLLTERDSATHITVLSGDLQQDDTFDDGNGAVDVTTTLGGIVPDATGNTGTWNFGTDNALSITTVSGTREATRLDGFTITAGFAAHVVDGGGMHIDTGSLTIANTVFSGNSSARGGGLYVDNGSPSLNAVVFNGNLSRGDCYNCLHGGGGMFTINSHPTLTDVTFTGNKDESSQIIVEGGGGMFNFLSDTTLNGVTFTDNSSDASGGGLSNQGGTHVLNDVTFINNTAATDGGGMVTYQATTTMTNAAFYGNSVSGFAGALAQRGGNATIINGVFSGNSAYGAAGAILFAEESAPMDITLTNVTITNNVINGTPWFGSGAAVEGANVNISLLNSIIFGNTGTPGSELYLTEASAEAYNTLLGSSQVEVADGGSIWYAIYNLTSGVDPLFTDPDGVDNIAGTPDDDFSLQGCSPVIDMGEDYFIMGVATDIAGNPRIDGAHVDMGAYERIGGRDANCPPLPPTDLTVTYDSVTHEIDLSWADNSDNETGFIIERQKDGAAGWVPLTTTAADATSYVDETVTCDQDYIYRVTATNAAGDSNPAVSGIVNTECNLFADVPTDLPAPFMEPWVEDFFQADITGGKPNCEVTSPGGTPTYCPQDNVTRGEMAVFIVRAMEYPNLPYDPPGDPSDPFADVFSGSTALPAPFMEDWIEEFYTRNITGGKGTCTETASSPDLTYCPKDLVTRGEMAVFILRALGVTPVDDFSDPFADVPGNLPAPFMEPWVETFLAEGITTGKAQCNDGTLPGPGEQLYCPQDNVTRAEMAVFILRAFDSIPDPNDP